jgi:hypothetical protein
MKKRQCWGRTVPLSVHMKHMVSLIDRLLRVRQADNNGDPDLDASILRRAREMRIQAELAIKRRLSGRESRKG